jgi:hypothetical protein
MADITNDIDALLGYLRMASAHQYATLLNGASAKKYHAALTALIAERNALRSELEGERQRFVKHLEDASRVVQTWPTWKQEVLGGTAVQPTPDRDRELRERLIESALRGAGTGAARSVKSSMLTEAEAEALGRQAVWMADGAFYETRKGEQP